MATTQLTQVLIISKPLFSLASVGLVGARQSTALINSDAICRSVDGRRHREQGFHRQIRQSCLGQQVKSSDLRMQLTNNLVATM